MRFLYINPDASKQARATTLGCGWMPMVPPEFAAVATAPCVILAGAGQTVVLAETATKAAVAAAAAPILAIEQAAQQADTTRTTNADALLTKARAAIGANATFLALTTPTNAQVLAQTRALTRQMNAFIKRTPELRELLDDVSDT